MAGMTGRVSTAKRVGSYEPSGFGNMRRRVRSLDNPQEPYHSHCVNQERQD